MGGFDEEVMHRLVGEIAESMGLMGVRDCRPAAAQVAAE
jgi:hypothetical protein